MDNNLDNKIQTDRENELEEIAENANFLDSQEAELVDEDNNDEVSNALIDISPNQIKDLIYTIRGKQVMLDSDLAILYQVETKNLNKAMKRNIDRFPENFCFRLTDDEFKTLRFQNGTSNETNGRGGRRFNPYMYSEQGIAMLSAVLKSEVAVKVSIGIMNAFVEMRKFLLDNSDMFARLTDIELNQLKYQNKIDRKVDDLSQKQLETNKRLDKTDQKFEKVFDYIAKHKEVSQKVFFDGQIYDAYSLLVSIIKKAEKSIILIDNYVDTITLDILSKRKDDVTIDIYTSKKAKLKDTEIAKFNAQYGLLERKYTDKFHDRFLILDEKLCYHIGTSIKDAGNKSFGINKIESADIVKNILNNL